MKAARLWIWFAALANLAGWSLSAVNQLNRAGYAVFFALTAGVFFLCRQKIELPPSEKFLRRFRRPLPLAFAAFAVLIFLGGALYPPSNYTGLNYHLARVLQWLAHGQWCWIHTHLNRMNFSACAFEWLSVPVVLFTHSDRAIFLLNFIPFLLLPGLVFSVFTRLGVAARVAWWWMWLLPTGYIFMLQAGSIGNDAFGAIFGLAALAFSCRAWQTKEIGDLWTSLLAAALLTGTKPTSLPLLLPWFILVFRLYPLLLPRLLPTLAVGALAVATSFAPIAFLNWQHSGDWLGRNLTVAHFEIHAAWIGITGNLFQLMLANFAPPVCPFAGWWNHHLPVLLPQKIVELVNRNFDLGFFTIGELPTEDWTGLGLGLGVLLAASVTAAFWYRGSAVQPFTNHFLPRWLARTVTLAAWAALLAFSVKSGLTTAGRLIAPYYPLLLPALLLGAGQIQVLRKCWWRGLVGCAIFSSVVVLILSPDRPLWPAQTILAKLVEKHPDKPVLQRAREVYTVYSQRNDALASVRALLPPDTQVVGFIGTEDDCDISLWRPFGSRRVEHFLLSDSPAFIRQRAQIVVVGGFNLQTHGQTINDWLATNHAELLGTTRVLLKISEGPQPWYVARMKPE
jgi:hypothetical protein